MELINKIMLKILLIKSFQEKSIQNKNYIKIDKMKYVRVVIHLTRNTYTILKGYFIHLKTYAHTQKTHTNNLYIKKEILF